MNMPGIRRVAVIGAGPAGAITTDALIKEQAFTEIRVFERKGGAGGTWVYDPSQTPGIPSLQDLLDSEADLPVPVPESLPCKRQRSERTSSHKLRFSDSGVYENLHSNLPPTTMSFTQEPLPESISEQTLERYGANAPFRHRSIIREWVKQIFVRNESHVSIDFHTTVELVEKRGQNWTLTLRKELPSSQQDQWWQDNFDAVVVASGHYSLPYVPNIPGLAEYEKRNPGSIQHSKHFRSVKHYAEKKVIVVGGSVSAFDALHEIRPVSKHPIIASLHKPLPAFGWAPFTHPHIEVRQSIARLDPETRMVTFEDGSTVSNVDIIFFATGYDFSFPFLPSVEIRNRRIQGLYQHVFKIDDPSLGFVGMVSGGLTFRVFEWQAVTLARFFAGRATLPPAKDMREWEQEKVSSSGNGLSFFNIASDYEGYFEGLRKLAGEPLLGTTGRVLPRFEKEWAEEFQKVVQARVKWWERERRKAEETRANSKRPNVLVEAIAGQEDRLVTGI